jgi:hypothetical protein
MIICCWMSALGGRPSPQRAPLFLRSLSQCPATSASLRDRSPRRPLCGLQPPAAASIADCSCLSALLCGSRARGRSLALEHGRAASRGVMRPDVNGSSPDLAQKAGLPIAHRQGEIGWRPTARCSMVSLAAITQIGETWASNLRPSVSGVGLNMREDRSTWLDEVAGRALTKLSPGAVPKSAVGLALTSRMARRPAVATQVALLRHSARKRRNAP